MVDATPRPADHAGRMTTTELAKFVADFESKILQPIREKRAVSDEILAIRPVALGVGARSIV